MHAIEGLIRDLIGFIDEDALREGLYETPKRVSGFYQEFLDHRHPLQMTVFDSEGMDEMIIQQGIPFYSLCEHHLLPFFGTATIAYIPNGKVLGLSKFSRVLDHFARKITIQERITHQVSEYLMNVLSPKGVAVSLKARHLCLEMRGIERTGSSTITNFLLGAFRDDPRSRAEFMELIK